MIFKLGALSGEQQGRADTAYRYQDSAKESAQRACVGIDPGRVFECVVEKVETAQAAAQSEQDLAAQQQAAWAGTLSSWWSLGALLATGLGLYWIKGTLDATRRGAEAAQGAVDETKRIGEAQTRAYLSVVKADFLVDYRERSDKNLPAFDTILHLRNSGQTPAVNVSYFCTCMVTKWKHRNIIPDMDTVPYHFFINNMPPNEPDKVAAICWNLANEWRELSKAWKPITEDTPFGDFPMLVIYGVIFYDDIFGQTFRSKFAFALEGVEPSGGPIRKENLSPIQTETLTFEPIKSRKAFIRDDT